MFPSRVPTDRDTPSPEPLVQRVDSVHSFILFIHSFIHSFIIFIHSSFIRYIHSLHSFILHSFCSFIHSFYSFILFIHCIHSFIHSFVIYIHYIHSFFIHSVHSFIHSIHSSIHSCMPARVPKKAPSYIHTGKTLGHRPLSPKQTEDLHTKGCGLIPQRDR